MERLIGIPLETALNGMPGLEDLRSTSIAGLNDIKCQFAYGTDYCKARQEVINRIGVRQQPAARASTPGFRPGAPPARSSATCSKGPVTPSTSSRPCRTGSSTAHSKTGPRRDRRDRLRRHGQAVPGACRHPAAAAIQRDPAAGRGRDHEVERQRRRRHLSAWAASRTTSAPSASSARGSIRSTRPTSTGTSRSRCAKLEDIEKVIVGQRPAIPRSIVRQRRQGRSSASRGSESSVVAEARQGRSRGDRRERRRRRHRPDAQIREVARTSPRRSPRRWRRSNVERHCCPRGCSSSVFNQRTEP